MEIVETPEEARTVGEGTRGLVHQNKAIKNGFVQFWQ